MHFKSSLFAIFLLVLLPLTLVSAEEPDSIWANAYGGQEEDGGLFVSQVHDGGYIITGHTRSYGAGEFDLYLVRLSSEGETLWTRAFGGSNWDMGKSVVETPDGGFIAVGLTYSFGAGNDDVYIVKTDSLGNLEWSRTYGGYSADEAYIVLNVQGGGYFVAGRTYSFGAGNFDVYMLRLDENGDTLWTRTYGGYITDGANSACKTADGGYILVGYTFSFGAGNYDVYVIKTDSVGNAEWTRCYGGYDDDVGTSIAQLEDGGYVISGYSYTYSNGADDFYVIRIDADGNAEWANHYGGSSPDEADAIVPTEDGGFLVAGMTSSYGHGANDVYLVRLDSTGTLRWDATYGGPENDGCRELIRSGGNTLLLVGYTRSFGHGDYDVYALKLGYQSEVGELCPPPGGERLRLLSMNTLFSSDLEVSFELLMPGPVALDLLDVSGRLRNRLFAGFMDAGRHTLRFETADCPGLENRSLYFLRLRTARDSRTIKFIHVR